MPITHLYPFDSICAFVGFPQINIRVTLRLTCWVAPQPGRISAIETYKEQGLFAKDDVRGIRQWPGKAQLEDKATT